MSQTGPFGPDPTAPAPGVGQPPPGQQGWGQPSWGQPGQGQPGWGHPGQGYYPVPQTNVLAILSLVMAFVFAPAGLVLGIIAKSQIRQTGEQGEGLATAGIVISAVFLAITVVAFIAFFAFAATVVSHIQNNTGFPNGNSGFPNGNTGIGLGLLRAH